MGSSPVGGSKSSFSEYFDLRTLLHYLHFIQVTNPFITNIVFVFVFFFVFVFVFVFVFSGGGGGGFNWLYRYFNSTQLSVILSYRLDQIKQCIQ